MPIKTNKMADISKCEGRGCGVKETCYRFKAEPNKYWQSYIKPDTQESGCEYYWNINNKASI